MKKITLKGIHTMDEIMQLIKDGYTDFELEGASICVREDKK